MTAVLFDKYFVLGTLGTGGTGRVLLAKHIYLGVKRAIKVIDKGDVSKECFYQETSILKNLSHSGIPVICDVEEDDRSYYIIEEYIEGQSLSAFFQDNLCDMFTILNIGIQICRIIEYIHGKVLHLDIKPQNIIYCNGIVHLVDFGSSIELNSGVRTYHTGTNHYSSPELISGQSLDVRSDIFSFGKVMQYMFNQAGIHMDDGVNEIILRCVDENKDMRFTSISPVLKYLMRVRDNMSGKQIISQSVLKIRIVGAKSGAGATHFAVMVCSWLNSKGIKSAYVGEMLTGQGGTVLREVKGICPVVNKVGDIICDVNEYSIMIEDKGDSKIKSEEDYILNILVAGGKSWEIANTARRIKEFEQCLCEEHSQLVVVFNFLNENQHKRIDKDFDLVSYSVPYSPDPYNVAIYDELMNKIFKDYLPELLCKEKRGTIFGKNDSKKVFRFIR